ncbi:hypothetical protein [Candidatus Binatus sp.]|uniref:hypothetical protein n=1 Tax=Candidatus Binatus sp. TaxID=2811406 RepID=UPI00272B04BC|nr:hypothetical protein [Candidatus Binatus sp.]
MTNCAAADTPANYSVGGGFLLDSIQAYFENWFVRSDQAKAEQPHWITPLVTVTPRLEQELRYDQIFQARQHGETLINFGGSKGLELIPTQNTEIILGIPPYLSHQLPGKAGASNRGTDDFGDWTALVKYRLLSANEENGNYIVSVFMGFLAPTGAEHNSQGHAIFTPTIAFGKGWGNFDFQSTVSASFPNGGLDRLGMPVAYNTAFQYHMLKYLWPECEVNYTWFPDGDHAGKNEVFLTPGIVAGRIPLYDRLVLVAGAGFQVAVSKFERYHNAWVITARIPF